MRQMVSVVFDSSKVLCHCNLQITAYIVILNFSEHVNANDRNDPLCSGGHPNPRLRGRPLHFHLSGADPDPDRISEAASLLGTPIRYLDDDGYEHEVVASSPVSATGELAYVTCKSKQLKRFVDVSFRFIVRDAAGQETDSEVESYNPFFGCNVRFLEWFGATAILIYKEKHDMYVAAGKSQGPTRYHVIADQWIIKGNEIGYWEYKETEVRRIRLPELDELEPFSEADAIANELCPEKYW
jgi:hypothetical protein